MHLTIKFLDNYILKCEKNSIQKEILQSIGVTSLFIAFKYENTKKINFGAEFLSGATNF